MAALASTPTQGAASAALPALTPFEVERIMRQAAKITGYSQVTHRPVIRIDTAILPDRFWTKKPDYAAIRRALLEGRVVPGAELTMDIEYVLAEPAPGGRS